MDDCACGIALVREAEELQVALPLERPRCRQRRGARMAERRVELLDGEDVGEIRGDLERELDLHPPPPVVLDSDALFHRIADEALTLDGELVRLETANERIPQHERGAVRHRLRVRERLWPLASERQDRAGEETRVRGEESRRGCRPVDVAALVADAERRAFENFQRHGAQDAAPNERSVSASNRITFCKGTENDCVPPACSLGSTGSFATRLASPRRRCASCSSPRYSTTSTVASYRADAPFPPPRRMCSGRKPASLPLEPIPSVAAGSRFIAGEPMNVATKVFAGLVYRSSGEPICCRTPLRMTAIRSPIVIASIWSCVT